MSTASAVLYISSRFLRSFTSEFGVGQHDPGARSRRGAGGVKANFISKADGSGSVAGAWWCGATGGTNSVAVDIAGCGGAYATKYCGGASRTGG